MVHFKLCCFLLILLSFVYSTEAETKLDEYNKFYTDYKKFIVGKINKNGLYHTQISCYQCIFFEINKQLYIINNFPNTLNETEKVDQMKSDAKLFAENYKSWEKTCNTHMPTDTRNTFYMSYPTTHYTPELFSNGLTSVEVCMNLFVRKNVNIQEFYKIKVRYEDDIDSHENYQGIPGIVNTNKKCMKCIQDFISYEVQRWNEIEGNIRTHLTDDKMLGNDLKDFATLKDIFTNYQRYIDKIQKWVSKCALTSVFNVPEDDSFTSFTLKQAPYMENGNSRRLEACISYFVDKDHTGKKFVSSGKTRRSDNEIESRPTELIQLITS